MKARIISVGDELLRGDTVDTNAAFISSELDKLGIETVSRQTCGDDLGRISSAITKDCGEEKIVIVTGGLGPTDDDLTRDAFANALGAPLMDDSDSIEEIRAFFKARGRTPGERNLRQGRLPKGSVRLRNEWGTAPGFVLEGDGRIYYCLPGVPLELENIFRKSLLPDLKGRFKISEKKNSLRLKIFGIPESRVNEITEKLQKPPCVSVGYYPRMPEIHIVISYALSDSRLKDEALNYIERVKTAFKGHLFGENDEKIEEKLVDALIKNKLTLSVAESCTGGLLSAHIINVAGSSACFERSVVSYSDASKIALLGVSERTLREHGAVSPECAVEMAAGIRKISGTDIGLSITGIAGPSGGTEGKPVGTTYIGFSAEKVQRAEHFLFRSTRNINRIFTVYEAIMGLLKMIDERINRI